MELLNMNKLSLFLSWILFNHLINMSSSNLNFLRIKSYQKNTNFKKLINNDYCNILCKMHKNLLFQNTTKRNKFYRKRKKKIIFQFIFNNLKDEKRIKFSKKYLFPYILDINNYQRKKNYNYEKMKISAQLKNQLNSTQEYLDEKLIQSVYDNCNNNLKYSDFNLNNLKNYEKKIKKKNIHSILLCGGIGKRTSLATPKQLLKLNDIPLFIYSFNLFIKCNLVKTVTIVCDSKYFNYAVDNINMYNPLLLEKKIENKFLYNFTENVENKKINNKSINDEPINGETISDESINDKTEISNKIDIFNYLEKNEYIIYDNEKNKCIFDVDELLHDILESIENKKNDLNFINKNNRKKNDKIKIKLKNIDVKRYKLIRIIQSGKERLDSFLNATKTLDIYLNNQLYIYELIKNYTESKKQNNNYQFENLKEKDRRSLSNDNEINKNIKKEKKKNYITNILIHDGARPFLSEYDFFKLIYYSSLGKNAILGVKATDTVKLINNKEENNTSYLIKKTIKRDTIFQAQTPQIFDGKTLLSVLPFFFFDEIRYEKDSNLKSKQFTDTSSLFQYLTKKKVYALQSSFPNFKITTPADVFQSIFLMKHIYNFKNLNIEENIFKDEYINSDSSNILKNQFNNFFYYNSLNEKQKILYHNFYYTKKKKKINK
ncbi:2-C-methyl-D-erythritol 4-phosphate cytidylyltransferase, putative [Plasmodium relictum]|uniref:2-C-methyl-D-erythritol 4-phosphate cytidylyltransferase, putative n=1 Tax=Plasmodium relictum TaxID=85471 RepID=A0A1J1HCA1_PLARL|nr:2-C-methyl-D-erythritol 4-phosphate cytidylyltransferase, putative [Plasmodium relictum]CRH03076.1 2-C-methyl-D-erythritol 4-phosphate cytidylyltransferase, putative [Plasmodium relictum]